MSLLMATILSEVKHLGFTNVEIASTLSLFAGIVVLAIGLFRLGYIVDFISGPVIAGECAFREYDCTLLLHAIVVTSLLLCVCCVYCSYVLCFSLRSYCVYSYCCSLVARFTWHEHDCLHLFRFHERICSYNWNLTACWFIWYV